MTTSDNDSHFGRGRVTERRRAVAAAVDGFGGAFTIDDIVHAARVRSPGIGVATVYRAVAAMDAAGSIERVGSRDGSALYVRCTRDGHHHHLVCTACGKAAAASCPLDTGSVVQDAAGHGFIVTAHEITLYGLCATCAARSAADSATSTERED